MNQTVSHQALLLQGLVHADQCVVLSNVDPSLHTQYVSRSDYDTLKARYDAVSTGARPSQSSQSKAKKRARPSVTVEPREPVREHSTTPLVDDKGRKKRSMKLEVSSFLRYEVSCDVVEWC